MLAYCLTSSLELERFLLFCFFLTTFLSSLLLSEIVLDFSIVMVEMKEHIASCYPDKFSDKID